MKKDYLSLNEVNLAVPKDVTQDGLEFINISKIAKTELGKLLKSDYIHPFKTFLGDVASVLVFSKAIITPNYPLDLLYKKTKLTSVDIDRIPTNKVSVANYWALVAYAYCARIQQDAKLIGMLKNNTLPFVSFELGSPREFFGKTIVMHTVNKHMGKPIAILNYIVKLIKEDNFNDDSIKAFVELCKAEPEKDILDGVCNITVK